MTATTQTLTEFLLARVAEDEAWAAAAERQLPIPHSPPQSAARVLAECEAKRRIVERHGGEWPECVASTIDACPELRDLATVYADHPDYRQEWRP